MAYAIYDASVPVMARALGNLIKIIDKAETQAKEKDIPLQSLLDARLIADMNPFPFQIQSASDAAKGAAARLAGITPPSMPDTEKTFGELKARLQKTIDFLNTVKPEQLAGAEDKEIVMKFPNGELKFSGRDFLAGFALPNFFFHVTTAYALLRHKGIAIGKMDFLGGV
ncbi:MAG: DUF1993 domain-containing protein [Alphaproteobacteria bacterium]|nr:DUF1993 domain-containing protein [Alphaproteobacteria bacterium]MBV9905056.1 DUF1993 domain-containing protein [Alphaproteobacteria bacterium]